jgi:hypothetical protein
MQKNKSPVSRMSVLLTVQRASGAGDIKINLLKSRNDPKMSSVGFWWILFLFIINLGAPCAYGQTHQTFDSEMSSIREKSTWTLGPFKINPNLRLSGGYDNNIYGAVGGTPPVADYVATVSPQFNVYLPVRNSLILSFIWAPQYVYFAETKKERALNNNYAFGFRFLVLNRFVFSAGYDYARTKDRISSEIYRRIIEQVSGYRGSISFETARGTSIGISSSLRRYRYEDVALPDSPLALSLALDREEKNTSIELYYRIFSDSSFFINLGYTSYKFTASEARFRDSHSYQFYTGMQFPLLGRTTGTLSLGYKKFLPQENSLREYSGLVGDTSLGYRLGRFGFRLQYSRDVPFSYEINNIYFVDNRIGAGASYYVSQSIRWDYSFYYGQGRYPEKYLLQLPNGSSEELKRIDTYQYHSVGIVLRLIQKSGIGLRGNYVERKSNYRLFDLHDFFLEAFMTYEF